MASRTYEDAVDDVEEGEYSENVAEDETGDLETEPGTLRAAGAEW